MTRVAIALFAVLVTLTLARATTGGYNLPDFQCPAGTFVTGARWGKFVCSPLIVAPRKPVPMKGLK